MLEEAGRTAGVTSLSPTTVTMQAPRIAHHSLTLALANVTLRESKVGLASSRLNDACCRVCAVTS